MVLSKEPPPPSGTLFKRVVNSLQKKVRPQTRGSVRALKRPIIDRYHLYVSYACREWSTE